MRVFLISICLLFGGFLHSVAVAAEVTTESLLDEMTDLRGMAEFPDPPFTCRQFSSYDRAAVSPEENWFANGDRGHYLRVEETVGRTEHVMMDAEGPGAIVRIWSANPEGTLRIYIDGREKPVLEAPMKDFLGGWVRGIPKPIAGERSRGWNCYFPIPYAKHCKVTSDQGGFYYHVNYRTYDEGTKVESFRPELLETLAPRIREVADCLSAPRVCGTANAGAARRWFDVEVEPGRSETLAVLSGEAAITGLMVDLNAPELVTALRQAVLTMDFDGERTVEVPLGDFFGSAPGLIPYSSLPLGMTEAGDLWSHWWMPFREAAVIRVENHGPDGISVLGVVETTASRWTRNSMHFHAGWRTEFDIPSRPMRDWNFVEVEGEGVFVGAAMYVTNPVNNWWGEGDEKIYVDGEEFPSFFGTGTEDYFGYAWCCNVPFAHAYHNQPRCDGPGNQGNTSNNRWHIIDRIPFMEDFKFDMEIWHHRDDVNVTVAAVSYWYGKPGARTNLGAFTPEDLRLTDLQRYMSPRSRGAIEGETMEIVESVGNVGPQGHGGCSADRHMWWSQGGKPGEKITLGFDVARAGRYQVLAGFLKAGDYAIVQYSLNGEKVGEPIDLYSESIGPSGDVDFGVRDLKAGRNTITLEIVGANEKATKSYMASLDYLILQPVD
jgi:hypothetical protein